MAPGRQETPRPAYLHPFGELIAADWQRRSPTVISLVPKGVGRWQIPQTLGHRARASGGVKTLLRLEGLALFAGTTLLYLLWGGPWWLYAVLFLAPDLSFLGYLAGPKSAHGSIIPCTAPSSHGLLTVGFGFAPPLVLSLALIWLAHIGFDRALGYGLKYSAGFGFTHLGRIGKEAKNAWSLTAQLLRLFYLRSPGPGQKNIRGRRCATPCDMMALNRCAGVGGMAVRRKRAIAAEGSASRVELYPIPTLTLSDPQFLTAPAKARR